MFDQCSLDAKSLLGFLPTRQVFEFLLDQCSLDAEPLLGFLPTQHESLMVEGATSEKVVNECAAKAISNPGEIGKVDKETNLPTSVDEVALADA